MTSRKAPIVMTLCVSVLQDYLSISICFIVARFLLTNASRHLSAIAELLVHSSCYVVMMCASTEFNMMFLVS